MAFATLASSVSDVRENLGLGRENPYVDVKLMASLLSMDAYTIPFFGGGTASVREVQQWMNGLYVGRSDFAIVPCDGIFSRQVQTALLFALQYEFGMADGVANGNFGPGTRDGLRQYAQVVLGSEDSSKHFVRLFQASMRFNRNDVPFNGDFDASIESKTREFQEFMEIPSTGRGDYTTWCNLLVSSGDTTIRTAGFDTSRPLTSAMASAARSSGYTHVGRYTVGEGKFIGSGELAGLRAAGLRLFPLHQRWNNEVSKMTHSAGWTQGIEAIERGRALDFPEGSTIFFSVDFDPVGEAIHGPVLDFFDGVNDAMGSVINQKFKVGVYGTRNVCQVVTDDGKADAAFVAGMSTGWSGNMGFPMPDSWDYNQIVELNETFAGTSIPVDHVTVSNDASSIDLESVTPPPTEKDGSATATGFDVVFEWVVRAEVAVERGIKAASSLLNPLELYASLSKDYILDWLRKPEYGDGSDGGMWDVYLIKADTNQQMVLARAAAEDGLQAMSPAKPVSTRDVAHFAATALGYRTWGVPDTVDDYGNGDLGGWALDLLQTWGVYDRLGTAPDLMAWMTSNVGANDESGFGYADVVADADAWLIAKALKDGNETLSGSMRELYQLTSRQRIQRFYTERFGGSEGNVARAFAKMATGLDGGSIEDLPFTDQLLMKAANTDTLPTNSQAQTCGSAFARVLARLGS